MSQSHLNQLYSALTQRGWKIVEYPRGDDAVPIYGTAATWEIRCFDDGPAIMIDFAGFGGMGEDLPLEESYACRVRDKAMSLYFSRVNHDRERWETDLRSFVDAIDTIEGESAEGS